MTLPEDYRGTLRRAWDRAAGPEPTTTPTPDRPVELGCECYDTGGNYGVCAEHAEDARHPESYCHRCGGPNITWWAPSPVWNHVMGYPEEAHDGIVCPLCFAELAEAKGAGEGWRVEPGRWPEGVSLVHTDGRVWDDRAGLWVDPAPVVPDSPDVRERVRRAVKRAATWTEDGPEYEEAPAPDMVEAITDAVLAVVGQDVTEEVEDEECAPDCDERAACDKTGVGHSMCGRCEHGEPRHHGGHFHCAVVRSGERGVE